MPPAKPTVFIGSSSEGRDIAHELYAQIATWASPKFWEFGFSLGRSTLDELLGWTARVDFAVLVLTADDLVTKRAEEHRAARANVLFELGLFIGALGPGRAFAAVQRGVDIPTDLAGLMVAIFDLPEDGDLRNALLPTCLALRRVALEAGLRSISMDSQAAETTQQASGIWRDLGSGHNTTSDLFRGFASRPVCAMNSGSHLEAFCIDSSCVMHHIWETGDDREWSDWGRFGSMAVGTPAITQFDDGLTVLTRRADGSMAGRLQREVGLPWTDWRTFGEHFVSSPYALLDRASSVIHLFALRVGGHIGHVSWPAGEIPEDAGVDPVGGTRAPVFHGDPVAAMSGDGRLAVVATDSRGAIWTTHQSRPVDGEWLEWTELGGIVAGVPAITPTADGRVAVAARTATNALGVTVLRHPTGSLWGSWRNLEVETVGSPAIYAPEGDGLEVYAATPRGTIVRIQLGTSPEDVTIRTVAHGGFIDVGLERAAAPLRPRLLGLRATGSIAICDTAQLGR